MVTMKLSEFTSAERGRKARLAHLLNVPQQLVGQWANGLRPTPVNRCVAIERATGGTVTRRDLRPDDWHLIWPELAEQPKAEEASHG